jgi:NAD+ synthase (glutamine-hydrolysing)
MDYAGKVGGIVIGTGDLSELALGWCTYNGDHMSMYAVNGTIPKTLVRLMVEVLADEPSLADAREALMDIIITPVSPELLPHRQITENLIGPYALHDFFLYHMLRYAYSPTKIYTLACRAFAGEYSAEEVKKWLRMFYSRFFAQQFKRNALPDGVKVGSISLSPRGDWRMPSDASARIWLDEVDKLS